MWEAGVHRAEGIDLSWSVEEPLEVLVQRREHGQIAWRNWTDWLPEGTAKYFDSKPGECPIQYRLVARDLQQRLTEPSSILSVTELLGD
jgi:hypothetical protein